MIPNVIHQRQSVTKTCSTTVYMDMSQQSANTHSFVDFSCVYLSAWTPQKTYKYHFFLFQLNAYNVLNTYIYHHLPTTCFGVCYTIFRETIALLAQKLYAYCNVATKLRLLQRCYKITLTATLPKNYAYCNVVTKLRLLQRCHKITLIATLPQNYAYCNVATKLRLLQRCQKITLTATLPQNYAYCNVVTKLRLLQRCH